jgi:D-beta-D-heptose 7-phosphate kinase/D-beta-D-heptose 1-phosphate adenosyltransferase
MQFDAEYRLLDGFHAARVLVVGDVMLDRFIYGTVDRISPEAPIPVVSVEQTSSMPGGAANVARNIASLGGRCVLLGVVGEDIEAQELSSQLTSSSSVQVRLIADKSRPTSVKTRYVANGQQVMRADREIRRPLPEEAARRLLHEFTICLVDTDIVILSDYAKGVLSDFVLRHAISAVKKTGKTVIVDPKAKNLSKYSGATILTPNRAELQLASGEECATDAEVVDAARRFLTEDVCEVMVVTRGKDGMSVVGPGDAVTHLPTVARQVFDVSGAGDTVLATLSLGLASGGTVFDSANLANIAAGIVVGKRGTATVTTGEVVASMPSFEKAADPQKIYSLDNVLHLVRDWREQRLKICFTNGCFDLLHPGHISLLEQARAQGDRLVVGLNADLSIRQLKGPKRPVQSEIARATVLAAIKSVDAVVIFSEDTPIKLIEALQPDVLIKGADYSVDAVVGADFVMKHGGRVFLATLLSGHSTTNTVKRLVSGE